MTTRQISVQRFSVTSSKPFEKVVAAIDAKIGHPDMKKFGKDMVESRTEAEFEKVVQGAVGPSDLMEFIRFDIGGVLRKELKDRAPNQVLRQFAAADLFHLTRQKF